MVAMDGKRIVSLDNEVRHLENTQPILRRRALLLDWHQLPTERPQQQLHLCDAGFQQNGQFFFMGANFDQKTIEGRFHYPVLGVFPA